MTYKSRGEAFDESVLQVSQILTTLHQAQLPQNTAVTSAMRQLQDLRTSLVKQREVMLQPA